MNLSSRRSALSKVGKPLLAVVVIILVTAGIAVVAGALLPGSDAQKVFFGIGISLACWTLTFFAIKLCDNSFERHDGKTTKILDVVTGKFVSLERQRRDAMTSAEYKSRYRSADIVKISGIANKSFCRDFFCDSSSNNVLLEQMKTRKVEVQVLFANPFSEIITLRDKHWRRARLDRDEILDVIDVIRQFWDGMNKDTLRLHHGSSLEVRLTSEPLNTTMFYTKNSNGGEAAEELLMGMLFAKVPGLESQILKIPRLEASADETPGADLYTNCLRNFDNLFENSYKLFYLGQNGPKIECLFDLEKEKKFT